VECQVRIRIDFERARAEVARIHWAPRNMDAGGRSCGGRALSERILHGSRHKWNDVPPPALPPRPSVSRGFQAKHAGPHMVGSKSLLLQVVKRSLSRLNEGYY
jgi:hypothetical protein